jgi:hypothetical protein
MEKYGTVPILVKICQFLKYWYKPILNGTVGNLDIYTYIPHSDGSKIHYAHDLLSLY